MLVPTKKAFPGINGNFEPKIPRYPKLLTAHFFKHQSRKQSFNEAHEAHFEQETIVQPNLGPFLWELTKPFL